MKTIRQEYSYLRRHFSSLKTVPLLFEEPGGNRWTTLAAACYDPSERHIKMSPSCFSNRKCTAYALIVLLHEARHALQFDEGWWRYRDVIGRAGVARMERDADEWAWKTLHELFQRRYHFRRKRLKEVFLLHVYGQRRTYGRHYAKWWC